MRAHTRLEGLQRRGLVERRVWRTEDARIMEDALILAAPLISFWVLDDTAKFASHGSLLLLFSVSDCDCDCDCDGDGDGCFLFGLFAIFVFVLIFVFVFFCLCFIIFDGFGISFGIGALSCISLAVA